MPRRSGVLGPPNGYLARNGSWPDGPFAKGTPASVLYAADISRRLRASLEASGETLTAAAGALGVARSTLYDIMRGDTFPDLHTLANAEAHFGVRLWPTD